MSLFVFFTELCLLHNRHKCTTVTFAPHTDVVHLQIEFNEAEQIPTQITGQLTESSDSSSETHFVLNIETQADITVVDINS